MSDTKAVAACKQAVQELTGLIPGFSEQLAQRCETHADAVTEIFATSPCRKYIGVEPTQEQITASLMSVDRERLANVLAGKSAGNPNSHCNVTLDRHREALDPQRLHAAVTAGTIPTAALFDTMMAFPELHTQTALFRDQARTLLASLGPVGTRIMRLVMKYGSLNSTSNSLDMARELVRRERDPTAIAYLYNTAMRSPESVTTPATYTLFPDTLAGMNLLFTVANEPEVQQKIADILVNAPLFNHTHFPRCDTARQQTLRNFHLDRLLQVLGGSDALRAVMLMQFAQDPTAKNYTAVRATIETLATTSDSGIARKASAALLSALPPSQ